MRREQTRRANPAAWPSSSVHCLCLYTVCMYLCAAGGAWCRSCGARQDRTALHCTDSRGTTHTMLLLLLPVLALQQWYHSLLRLVNRYHFMECLARVLPAAASWLWLWLWVWVWLARSPVWLQRETDSISIMVMVIVSTCAAGVMPRSVLSCPVWSCVARSRPARARRTADRRQTNSCSAHDVSTAVCAVYL